MTDTENKSPARKLRRPRASRSQDPTALHPNQIGRMRELVGMTQGQVIAQSGMSESYYKKMEAGRRPLTAEAMVILSPILRCRPADMVGPDPDDVTQEQLMLANFRLMDQAARNLILATARQFAG